MPLFICGLYDRLVGDDDVDVYLKIYGLYFLSKFINVSIFKWE